VDRSNENKVFYADVRSAGDSMPSRLLSKLFWPSLILLLLLLIPFAAAQQNTSAYQSALLAIQQHIESGDLSGANTLLTQAVAKYPSDGGIENLRGVLAAQQGDTAAAERYFSQAVRHSPKLVSAWLNLGRAYMLQAANNPAMQAKALGTYQSALALAPANAEANYQSAVLLMLAGKYQVSLDHVGRLDATARSTPGALALLAADHAGLGHKAEAEQAADALAQHPDLTEADALEIAPVLNATGHAALAIATLNAAAQRAPLSPAGLRALALSQETAGNLADARKTLEIAFTADPKSISILVDLARVAKAQKDYQGALGYLAHARDLEPRDARLSYYFGLVCLDLNLLGEARKALEEAVRLAPDDPDYNYVMGSVSAFAQDPELALPYLKKFHSLRPQNPAGILALGTTYFRAKDFDTAAVWLRQAADSPKTAATAHYYLGRIARQQARLDDALSELNLSNQLKPDRPETLAELGQVYVQQRKFTEAEKELSLALAISPDNYAANFGLLQLYARTADPRREQQSRRFDEIKSTSESQYQDMMRIIEIRPEDETAGK
jgi:tetratricopeptide (TPR) repeat protein